MAENPVKILLVRYDTEESMAAGEANTAVADIASDSGLGWGWIENALEYFEPNTPGKLVILVSSCSLQDTIVKARSIEEVAKNMLGPAGWNVSVVINREGIPPVTPDDVRPDAESSMHWVDCYDIYPMQRNGKIVTRANTLTDGEVQ